MSIIGHRRLSCGLRGIEWRGSRHPHQHLDVSIAVDNQGNRSIAKSTSLILHSLLFGSTFRTSPPTSTPGDSIS